MESKINNPTKAITGNLILLYATENNMNTED